MATELTERQITECRDLLRERSSELREQIRVELEASGEESYADLAGQVHDLEEAALADLLTDLELAEVDRHVAEFREIQAALMRIAQGTYGTCSDCENPIRVERLRVNPTARRCLRCQELYERTHEHPPSHGI
ncbi:MAG TPA: TraR/DksA family transcriptional regulator [Gammaproteobacteria bacterium]|nr:TraR/DksA family transcriptional regulator [Gammaproteobacteria bacterium]